MNKHYSLAELSEFTDADLVGDPELKITNFDTLDSASEQDASFLANPRYNDAMKQSNAGVICVDRNTDLIKGKNFLISDNPSRTFQLIAEMIVPPNRQRSGFQGIHSTAVIHESATIGRDVTIGPHAVIDAYTTIGDNTQISPSVTIGSGVTIGKECILHPGSIVRERCSLGDRVILQPGAVIGSCGFGYTTDQKSGEHTKLDHFGSVILEDDVEIGANSTIDRARFKNTLIRRGTKIDNLVQIAHNVKLGENNIIVSQTGIAGSAILGNNVFLGGQAGVLGHLTVCDNVKVATRGGVTKSVKEPGIYGGNPLSPMAEHNKHRVMLRKIEKYVKEIADLKKRLDNLEK
ncbi:MAG: UDP-3-O-acylglucosamine N-acyltransferase [Chlamydiae bacterium]|nr:UDP-3-O-acylglucosamine N-acyltransferase [Chlamydiota bacterium]